MGGMARTEHTDFEAFVFARTSLTSVEEIGDAAGISRSTYYRHRLPQLPIEYVVAALESLDLPILEGLVAAGWVRQAEVDDLAMPSQVRSMPDTMLLEELLQRAEQRDRLPADELAAKRAEREAARGPESSAPDLVDDFYEREPFAAEEGAHNLDGVEEDE